MKDAWNPEQYDRFKNERTQPAIDLMAMIRVKPGMNVVDLGCGTGEHTLTLLQKLPNATVQGVDSSQSMLDKADKFSRTGLSFSKVDIQNFGGKPLYDLIFSNAALQWIDDHPQLFTSLVKSLKQGGQLAIQMPSNSDHPSHALAYALAEESPYQEALNGYSRKFPVLAPEAYAELLFKLGCETPDVRLQVYGHILDSSKEVVEWVKGTLLTPFQSRMTPEMFDQFLKEYTTRLMAKLGEGRYFYAFKRVLIWAAVR